MIFWLLIGVMTAAALFAVLWPLLRKPGQARRVGGTDTAVYRDQLDEVDRDCSAGRIGIAEAKAARVEISRRLIAAADAEAAGRRSAGSESYPGRQRLVAAMALVLLPLGAATLYLGLGSPDLAGGLGVQTARGGDEGIDTAVAQVEAHLKQNPNDGRGWEVIAPVYMRIGRYADAVKARRNALRLLGATAERQADLGEALVAAANGVVTPEAKATFDDAIRADPTDVSARFYQGLAAEQDGDPSAAARLWRSLLADAPEGASWTASVLRALARVDPSAAKEMARNAPSTAPSPAGADPMVRGMVERLAARLKQDGSDVEGWTRLVRSYLVLKDPERARAAEADARQALANDPDKLRRLEDGLKALSADMEGEAGPPVALADNNAAAPPAGDNPMIRGMVERLAARLKQDGSDVDGWTQLVRSYHVLKDSERARAAEADARTALANDPEKLRRLEEGLKTIAAGAAPQTGAAAAPANKAAAPALPDHTPAAMVDRLVARLQADGSDLDGWLMLVRSYKVLGEPERARKAADDARRALAADPDKLRRLEDGVRAIDLQSPR